LKVKGLRRQHLPDTLQTLSAMRELKQFVQLNFRWIQSVSTKREITGRK